MVPLRQCPRPGKPESQGLTETQYHTILNKRENSEATRDACDLTTFNDASLAVATKYNYKVVLVQPGVELDDSLVSRRLHGLDRVRGGLGRQGVLGGRAPDRDPLRAARKPRERRREG